MDTYRCIPILSALFLLSIIACSGSEEGKLKIKNESSYDVKNVIWNNEDFGEIQKGFHVEKSVNAGIGHIYLTKATENLETRTDTIIVVNPGELREFAIQNNTLVIETANSDNKKTLSTIEATPPIFWTLMLQYKDLSKGTTWNAANDLCDGSEIGGYTDWRLPTPSELGVIYNNKISISDLTMREYWSSNLYRTYEGASYYYYYDLSNGRIDNTSGSYRLAVRCVRTMEKAEVPQAGNLNITDISYVSAKLNSSIAKPGNPQFTEKGFCYGITKNPAKGSGTCKKVDDAAQSFSLLISDLADSTTYYARAYLDNQVNSTQYSEEKEFQTLDGTPSVKINTTILETTEPAATLNGTILKPGYPEYAEKGFCYGILPDPSIGNSTCEKVDGTASSFSLHISNLAPVTRYYVRAYIDNGVHPVQYSDRIYFKSLLSVGSPLVDARDGKTYKTASFSSYTWMIDDLKYNSNTSLYTWNEAIEICPSGWHLPNDSEWDALSTALGSSANVYFTDATGVRWWSATASGTSARLWDAWVGDLERSSSWVDKTSTRYVRCVMD